MPDPGAQLPGVPRLLAGHLSYQVRVLVRTPRALVGGLLLPLLFLALKDGASHSQARVVAGLATFGMLSTAYITHTSALVAARQAGVLKRWRTTPLPRWCFFAGRVGATVLVATAGGVVTVLAAASLHDVHLRSVSLPAVGMALLVGAGTWASIGTAASVLIPSVEATWPLLAVSYLPVVVLSGAFGPVSGEAAWLHELVRYLPAQPVLDSTWRALRGVFPFTAHDLALELAWTAAGLLIALRWFSWAPRALTAHRPKRTPFIGDNAIHARTSNSREVPGAHRESAGI
jgi:ABC-2 type transport system permease protein